MNLTEPVLPTQPFSADSGVCKFLKAEMSCSCKHSIEIECTRPVSYFSVS
jgi:hypothetical protein